MASSIESGKYRDRVEYKKRVDVPTISRSAMTCRGARAAWGNKSRRLRLLVRGYGDGGFGGGGGR